MEDRLEALEGRVRGLEREVRYHRVAVALSLVLLAGGGWWWGTADASRKVEAEVRARRFALVGASGEPLAALEAPPGAGPRLSLLGPGGVSRVSLELAADGASALALGDAAGRKRILLEAGAEEARVTVLGLGQSAVTLANGGVAPRVAVADPAGRDRVWLAVRVGAPVIQFLDARGAALSGLTTFNDDTGVAVVSSPDRLKPGLVLWGKDGKILWSAP